MERRSYGSSFLLPFGDNGEKTRLDFWRRHAEPIPVELLRITGWIDEQPSREVVFQSGARVGVARAQDKPPNVLFRVPSDGEGRREWERILFVLRLEQSRRRSVDLHLQNARRGVTAARAAEGQAWDRLFETSEMGKDAARRALAEAPGSRAAANAAQELASAVEQARGEASRWRIARRHTEDATRIATYWESHSSPSIYPGLFAAINAFLDMQALSVASLASDEFKKRPPRGVLRTPPLEDRTELVNDAQ